MSHITGFLSSPNIKRVHLPWKEGNCENGKEKGERAALDKRFPREWVLE
jgi:hypothetical protein